MARIKVSWRSNPDAEGEAIVTVADENQYKSLSYQWQKLVGGEWKNMPWPSRPIN